MKSNLIEQFRFDSNHFKDTAFKIINLIYDSKT